MRENTCRYFVVLLAGIDPCPMVVQVYIYLYFYIYLLFQARRGVYCLHKKLNRLSILWPTVQEVNFSTS